MKMPIAVVAKIHLNNDPNSLLAQAIVRFVGNAHEGVRSTRVSEAYQ